MPRVDVGGTRVVVGGREQRSGVCSWSAGLSCHALVVWRFEVVWKLVCISDISARSVGSTGTRMLMLAVKGEGVGGVCNLVSKSFRPYIVPV